jgi:hypothetical protein
MGKDWNAILQQERARYAARGEPVPGRERLNAMASRGVLPGPTRVATTLPETPPRRRPIEGWQHALAYAYDPEPVDPPSTTQAAIKRIATGMRLSTACLRCHGEGWLPIGFGAAAAVASYVSTDLVTLGRSRPRGGTRRARAPAARSATTTATRTISRRSLRAELR